MASGGLLAVCYWRRIDCGDIFPVSLSDIDYTDSGDVGGNLKYLRAGYSNPPTRPCKPVR